MRVDRSFAFVDVSGFTALTELEGDERAVDVLTAFRALLRDICSRRGVRIAKWLGDGAMLVGVTTRPLLETILELHYVVSHASIPLDAVSIRSGTAAGPVILMEGDDYVGHCVNVASRLCDVAAAGEALAAPEVTLHLPSWGRVASQTYVELRGVENPVPASSIEMAFGGPPVSGDPICGLPLTADTAIEVVRDAHGTAVLFCSVSCLDTWSRRPLRAGSL